MKRLLCPRLPQPGRPVKLDESEASHAIKVLRLRDGNPVEALDGKGHAVVAILRLTHGQPQLEFSENVEARGGQGFPVTLELAVLKGDAMEWAIEKAVELGVKTLVPVLTDRTVVQTDKKGPEVFRDRWQKIADQALKQCGRLDSLEILVPTPLEEVLMQFPAGEQAPRLWLDESGREDSHELFAYLENVGGPLDSARVLVGPEGGWSDRERDLLTAEMKSGGTRRLSLGPNVLRAETAALASVSLVTAWSRVGRINADGKRAEA